MASTVTYRVPGTDRLHCVDIKHVHVYKLAFLSQIITRGGLHLPGNVDYSGNSFGFLPNGVAALIKTDSIPNAT